MNCGGGFGVVVWVGGWVCGGRWASVSACGGGGASIYQEGAAGGGGNA
eukprot:COSAG01_NODE_71451_length_256_cov_0.286624_1_plen_47_part_01